MKNIVYEVVILLLVTNCCWAQDVTATCNSDEFSVTFSRSYLETFSYGTGVSDIYLVSSDDQNNLIEECRTTTNTTTEIAITVSTALSQCLDSATTNDTHIVYSYLVLLRSGDDSPSSISSIKRSEHYTCAITCTFDKTASLDSTNGDASISTFVMDVDGSDTEDGSYGLQIRLYSDDAYLNEVDVSTAFQEGSNIYVKVSADAAHLGVKISECKLELASDTATNSMLIVSECAQSSPAGTAYDTSQVYTGDVHFTFLAHYFSSTTAEDQYSNLVCKVTLCNPNNEDTGSTCLTPPTGCSKRKRREINEIKETVNVGLATRKSEQCTVLGCVDPAQCVYFRDDFRCECPQGMYLVEGMCQRFTGPIWHPSGYQHSLVRFLHHADNEGVRLKYTTTTRAPRTSKPQPKTPLKNTKVIGSLNNQAFDSFNSIHDTAPGHKVQDIQLTHGLQNIQDTAPKNKMQNLQLRHGHHNKEMKQPTGEKQAAVTEKVTQGVEEKQIVVMFGLTIIILLVGIIAVLVFYCERFLRGSSYKSFTS